jgi:hypothetical protein
LREGKPRNFAKTHRGEVFREKSLQCIVGSSAANSKFAKGEKEGRDRKEKATKVNEDERRIPPAGIGLNVLARLPFKKGNLLKSQFNLYVIRIRTTCGRVHTQSHKSRFTDVSLSAVTGNWQAYRYVTQI